MGIPTIQPLLIPGRNPEGLLTKVGYSFLRFFLDVYHFFKSLLNLLQYCFYFMFWLYGHETHGILAPQPGIEPALPALEGEVITSGHPGKSLWATLCRMGKTASSGKRGLKEFRQGSRKCKTTDYIQDIYRINLVCIGCKEECI